MFFGGIAGKFFDHPLQMYWKCEICSQELLKRMADPKNKNQGKNWFYLY